MKTQIQYSKKSKKQLAKAPLFIQSKLAYWVDSVEKTSLEEVRKSAGFHDEPLKGKRQGQRSIRLNQQWRAIYTISPDKTVTLVTIEEVTPHDY